MTDAEAMERLWRAIENERQAPRPIDLRYLSGLLVEDIQRFARSWPSLAADVRQDLMRTLTQMAEADFEMDFTAVFRLALEDSDAEVRVLAIEGLHEDEDVRLVPRFARFLTSDGAVSVRAAAAQALGQFVLLGELGKTRPKPFEEAVYALNACYSNLAEDLEVRRRALESLAYCGRADIVQAITEAYAHSDERMRVSAVFAMGRSADKRWGDTVRSELHALAPEMRYEATRACGELQLREAAPELVGMVEDGDAEVQEMALWALGQIGGELALRTLRRYARSRDEVLQTAAREALDELEFFQGDLDTFFGTPEAYERERSDPWADMLEEDEDNSDEEDSNEGFWDDADLFAEDEGDDDSDDDPWLE